MIEAPAVETDPALLERCAVSESAQRIRLLRQLLDPETVVFLRPPVDPVRVGAARIEAIDTQRDSLDLAVLQQPDDADARLAEALRGPGGVTAIALAGGVKLQFELVDPVVLGDGLTLRLRARLPQRLARIQRREAYRVSPPAQVKPRLWQRRGSAERELAIADVSATGLAYELPEGQPLPRLDERLDHFRLELPANAPIRCSLVVRGLRRPPAGSSAPVRVGCEFHGLDASAERAIQVFVNLAQVQGRQRRPMLG